MTAPVGRESELKALDAFLRASRTGARAFEIVGEPGIGKTACWAWAVDASGSRFKTLSSRPTNADARMAFGVLSDLLEPIHAQHGAALPPVQRLAMDVALRKAPAPRDPAPRWDPRAVAMATLSCLRAAASERPVLIAIDDLQWVDRSSARVLEYVLRRMDDGPTLLVTRRSDRESPLDLGAMVGSRGKPVLATRLALEPLGLPALQQVLTENVGKRFVRRTLRRMADAAGGNVLLMLELARALPEDLDIAPGDALPIPAEIASLLRRRVIRLSAGARSVLLHAALMARPTLRQLRQMSGDEVAGAIREGEAARIIGVHDGVVRFAHPLLGAATIATAGPMELSAAHRRIAATSDSLEERARHIAFAAHAPREDLGPLLAAAAAEARERGAPDAAAELMELKSHRDPATPMLDLVSAGELHFEAGSIASARHRFEAVIATAPPGVIRAHALRGLAWVSYQGSSWTDAEHLLDQALGEPLLGDAVVGRLQTDAAMVKMVVSNIPGAAALAASASRLLEPIGPPADLGEAIALDATFRFFAGAGIDTSAFERAIALEDWSFSHPAEFRPSMLFSLTLYYAGLLDAARPGLLAVRERLRELGQEHGTYLAAFQLSLLESLAGNLDAAEAYASQAMAAVEINGQDSMRCFALLAVARASAVRGRLDEARAAANEGLAWASRAGALAATAQLLHVLGFAALSAGDAAEAAIHLEPLTALLEAMGVGEPAVVPFLADAIETLIALGQLDRAARLLEPFEVRAGALHRDWALATSARCRGQLEAALGNSACATAAFEAAVAAHQLVPMPVEKGRTLLAQGRFLRRTKQWRAARQALADARDTFAAVGAAEWGRRAQEEIDRIGGRRANPSRLSATEERIAVLVGEGRTNREIADALYLSVSSVESALTRIYARMGVRSRSALTAARSATPRSSSPGVYRQVSLVDRADRPANPLPNEIRR